MQKIMIRRQNFLQLLSFSRHILSSLRIQCHFNSKFVYGANRNSFYVFLSSFTFFKRILHENCLKKKRNSLRERVKCRRNVHFSRFKNRLCSASFFSVNVNTYLLWDSPTTFHSTIFHIGRCWGYCHGVFCCIYTAFNQIEIIFFTHERFSHSLEVAIKIDIRAHVMKRLGGRNGKECRLWKKI